MKKCVFAGTFDPPTCGHESIVKAALKIFDEVVVAVMINPQKTPLLSEEERKSLLEKLFKSDGRVKVKIYGGAAVDVLESENTPFYVRGVRNTVDFEYENANYYASKKLKTDMVTIYIPADKESLEISSSLVKNFITFKKDFSEYIPLIIREDLLKLLENKNV